LTLHVFDGNTAARNLYERAGFAIDTIKYLKRLT
jgi:RimJ/RimL family protein N-acetyltransferase